MSVQWQEFIPKFIFLPYLLVGEFTWEWLVIHWWTVRFILLQCFMSTIFEGIHVALTMVKGYATLGLHVVIWPIVPYFLCDFYFYITLYLSPLQVGEIIKKLKSRYQL